MEWLDLNDKHSQKLATTVKCRIYIESNPGELKLLQVETDAEIYFLIIKSIVFQYTVLISFI